MSQSGFELGLDDASRAGIYETDDETLPALAAAARDAGLLVRQIDLDGCFDKATLLLRIATVMDVPAGMGRNWDGLSDALRDLSWLPAGGYALMFQSASMLRDLRPQEFDTLVDVLHETSQAWNAAQVPFWVFLALDEEPDTPPQRPH
jgi:hypothetical protein